MSENTKPYSSKILYNEKPQRTFRGQNLLQIAMPIGGIGAGNVCLNGIGGLQDISIHHTPTTSAMPDGHGLTDAAFGLIHFPETKNTRLLEGPYPKEWIYNQGLKAQGLRNGGYEGFPRFRNCEFTGEFPFGNVILSDDTLPVQVTITGFNPFIPGDVKNSAIPCAIMEYTFENMTDAECTFEFSYHLSHFAPGADKTSMIKSRNDVIPEQGINFYNLEPEDSSEFGSATLTLIGHQPIIKGRWFRGGWFDALSVLWREISDSRFTPNDGSPNGMTSGRNGGSVMLPITLESHQKITVPVLITWHFPNVGFSYGQADVCESDNVSVCDCSFTSARWHPYYAGQWDNAKEVASYVNENYSTLRTRTQTFHDALFSSTLPWYVKDAVSANLGIMKSPTVLLQENGNMWAWEGCFCDRGCCAGSCTHVWNYAQAFAFLFPSLERTLREQELERSMNKDGHITFRSALPDGEPYHNFHAASDGQLGGIMKIYREWQISGDVHWLKKMYPLAKRSMDFSIHTWDPDHLGVLIEPHHNTYDIEFWGPDGMCSSFYLGALSAMAQLSVDMGLPEEGQQYSDLAQKGAQYLDDHLFNGEYYEQKIMTEGLRAYPQYLEEMQGFDKKPIGEQPEEIQLIIKEGPKYQYGTGCISDGVMGNWLSEMCYVESSQNRENVATNLDSIFKYNFKHSLWDHANPQRPGFALGDEPGLLLCTWPKGGKPSLPFVYSDEVFTGIEYQVASHLIMNGRVDEGLSLVWSTRSRYDGHTRNPWNEYECGSYYARAMASYSLLFALSGIQYSAPQKKFTFAPRYTPNNMKFFFALGSAWGTLTCTSDKITINLMESSLYIGQLEFLMDGKKTIFEINSKVSAGQPLSVNY